MFSLIAKESCKSRILRFLINGFILLLLYDSILRKWFLPQSLSNALMSLKILVAGLIVVIGARYVRRFPAWDMAFAVVGFIVFCTTMLFGHGNFYVAIWGCFPYWIGLFFCTVLSKILSIDDIHRIAKLIVNTSIANGILLIFQFILPVSHFLNVSKADEDEALSRVSDSAAINLAGLYRPTGIFMSTSQSSYFVLIGITFSLYFLFIQRGVMKRKYPLVALVLLLLSGFLSVSRTIIIFSLGMLAFFMIFCVSKRVVGSFVRYVVIAIPVALILAQSPIGKSVISNMGKRFSEASEIQSGEKNATKGTINDIYERGIAYNIDALLNPHTIDGESIPFWGYGQGMSTQVGGRLLGNVKSGRSGFALAEWDGLRIVCESGVILGWIIIFIRMGYALRFFAKIGRLRRFGQILPVVIYPSFFLTFFLLNTWGNATNACLAFFMGGLFLATYNKTSPSIH